MDPGRFEGPGAGRAYWAHMVPAPEREAQVFFFYNSRMGCAGSLLVSIALTAVLLLALRACGLF